jgi:choline kinase
MVEMLSYNIEDLFEEVSERARETGVTTEEAWNELVEEVIDEHINWGEMDIDDDVTAIREALQSKWEEFNRGLHGGEISEG